MRAAGWLTVAVLCFAWQASLSAVAQAPEAQQAFAAGTRHFERGDFARALEQFRRARAAGMAEVAVLYNIGVCEYRTGAYPAAEESFRRIARLYPAMRALAHYNLGLSLLKQNRAQEARAAFERAERGDDEAVARLAAAMLSRLPDERQAVSPQTVRRAWSGFVDLGVGADDNVALLEDADIGAGRTADSGFGELFGYLAGPPGAANDWLVDASLYVVRYPDAGEFDQNVLRLGGTWRRASAGLGAWEIRAGPHYSYSTLDGDGFEQRFGAGVALRRRLTARSRFELRASHEEIDEIDSRFDFVAGSRQRFGAGLIHRDGWGRIAADYDYVDDDRADPSVSATRHRLRVAYRRRFDERWQVGGALRYRSSRYDRLSVTREEDLVEARLTLARDVGSGWQLTGDLSLSRNDSNVDGFSYDRNRITLGLNRTF